MPNLKNLEDLFSKVIFDELKLQDHAPMQHLKETPKRISRMFVNELFKGCYTEPPKITVFDNESSNHQLVCVKDVEIKSMCSHHFMPFYGIMNLGYIPSDKIAGLSKFARIAHYFAARPQVQEELTRQIVEYLNDKLHPIAIGARLRCKHLCMVHRGAKSNGWMETEYVITNPDLTEEQARMYKEDIKKETLIRAEVRNIT